MRKTTATLHDLDAAAPDQIVRSQSVCNLAFELDGTLGDIAALRLDQIRDRLERRRLAGAVGTEDGDDHDERHALEDKDDMVVHDLDVRHRKDRWSRISAS